MDLHKLTYGKSDSRLAEREPVGKNDFKRGRDEGDENVSYVPNAYQKTEGVFSSSLVFVISGGTKREKDFLRELVMRGELHSLRVVFLSKDGQGLQPYQMNETWSKIRREGTFSLEGQVYHLDDMDRVFLLTDVDEFYDQLTRIVAGHQISGQGDWIISNPCFEMWLYYCFRNDPDGELQCLSELSVDKRSQKLKVLGNKVIAGGLNPVRAFQHMKEGIVHSLEHYAEDGNGIPVLYATQMHVMAQFLVDTLNSNKGEYENFIRERSEWRMRLKKKQRT